MFRVRPNAEQYIAIATVIFVFIITIVLMFTKR